MDFEKIVIGPNGEMSSDFDTDAWKQYSRKWWQGMWEHISSERMIFGEKGRKIDFMTELVQSYPLGSTIVDIGSFKQSIPEVLNMSFSGKKIIKVDYACPKTEKNNDILTLKYDVDCLSDASFSTRKAILTCAKFLSISISKNHLEYIDSLFLSQVINYLQDYRLFFKSINPFLKKNAKIFVFNKVGVGFASNITFSPNRPKSNQEIITSIASLPEFNIVEIRMNEAIDSSSDCQEPFLGMVLEKVF